jgi:hypothetical protein
MCPDRAGINLNLARELPPPISHHVKDIPIVHAMNEQQNESL